MSQDDFEQPVIYNETKPTAKKEHRCCECGKTIRRGEQYVRKEGLWDGEFSTYKSCMECEKIRRVLYVKFDCNCALGGLYDDMANSGIDKEEVMKEAQP